MNIRRKIAAAFLAFAALAGIGLGTAAAATGHADASAPASYLHG
jgi:hypothetical protein